MEKPPCGVLPPLVSSSCGIPVLKVMVFSRWRGLLYGLAFVADGGGFKVVAAMKDVFFVVESVVWVLLRRGGSETA